MVQRMTPLIAKKRLNYAGKQYAVGDPFSASVADARILVLSGIASAWLSEEPPTVTKPRRQYRRRDMRAEA
jgi:hypothetical protein